MTVGLPEKEKGRAAAIKNPASNVGEILRNMQTLAARAQKCMCAAQQKQKRYCDLQHRSSGMVLVINSHCQQNIANQNRLDT